MSSMPFSIDFGLAIYTLYALRGNRIFEICIDSFSNEEQIFVFEFNSCRDVISFYLDSFFHGGRFSSVTLQ